MAGIVEQFGSIVGKQAEAHPHLTKELLLTAYRAYGLKLKHLPNRQLSKAKQYLGTVSMNCMVRPLAHPDRQILTSIFTPCEIFHSMGLFPMCAEQFATYTNGAGAEHAFVTAAEQAGISETFCSYHKIVVGAAISGVLPKPLAIVNTSLACDANNLTFRKAAELFTAPQFYIDIPYSVDEDAVAYVAEQLRELARWLGELTGHLLEPGRLLESIQRSQSTIHTLRKVLRLRGSRCVPTDLTSELYEALLTHNALGTEESLRYALLLRRDYEAAKTAPGRKILWLHTNPFYLPAAKDLFNYKQDPFIALSELSYDTLLPSRSEDPYYTMAARTVYNSYNGPIMRRADRALKMAKTVGADGAILFCHWGCKETCGASPVIADALESAGIPVLILSGDGVDRRNSPDGQAGTRISAFLEMLGG